MKINVVLIFLVILPVAINSQQAKDSDIPGDILVAFKDGNARLLSLYFNNSLELAIMENENIYSKTQAHQIIHSFFHQFPPREFHFIHRGGKENSRYAIGEFNCTRKKFRVTIYLKTNNQQLLIHQLRIEDDNSP